jgi:hypothetical protein
MGKSSQAQRLKYAQPAVAEKGWCDHCLDTLHQHGYEDEVSMAIMEAYENMRSGPTPATHEQAVDWIAVTTDAMVTALKSSGERYHRDTALESKAEAWGYYLDQDQEEDRPEPPALTPEEIDEYHAVVAREEARHARHKAEAS